MSRAASVALMLSLFCSASHAHFAADQQSSLRFANDNGYLVLSLPEHALPKTLGDDLAWQDNVRRCVWMTGSDGKRVPMEGILRASDHDHSEKDSHHVTVLGVFRGVKGVSGESLNVGCFGPTPEEQAYSLRISDDRGLRDTITITKTSPYYPLALSGSAARASHSGLGDF